MENIYGKAARKAIKLNAFGLLLWLLIGLDRDLRFTRWLETQLVPFPGEPERRCDSVAELVSASGTQPPWACIVEPQGYADPLFLVRVLEYKLRCHQELRHGPHGNDRYLMMAAVINLSDMNIAAELTWRPPVQADVSGEHKKTPGLEWSVWVVNWRKHLAQPLLEEIASGRVDGCLLAWISLMADADQPAILAQWKALVLRETDYRRRQEYAVLALIFAEKAGRLPLWRQALEDFNVEESTLANEWLAKGEHKSLLRVLRARFGEALAEDTVARIKQEIDLGTLERWIDLAATLPTIGEFQAAFHAVTKSTS